MTSRTARRAITAVVATALAAGATLAAAGSTSAADAAVPHHGNIYLVIGSSGKTTTVIMHGALNDVGTDPQNDSDTYDTLRFAGGTVRVTHPDKDGKYTPYFNTRTCYASFTETGKATLGRGTGTYRGIHGTVTYRSTGSFFLRRTKAGACDENAAPRAELFTVHAHGTLD